MAKEKSKIIVILAITALIGFVFLTVSNSEQPIDNNNCLTNTANLTLTLILFDQSNSFEKGDKDNLTKNLEKIISLLPEYEKVIAIELSPNTPFEPNVLFEKCNPEKEYTWSIILHDVRKIQENRNKFISDFNKSINEALNRTELNKSPILESISYISQRNDFKDAKNKNIYIVSDLIQNYGSNNFYKRIPPASQITDESIKSEPISFTNTHFYFIHAVRRSDWKSRKLLRDFWENWVSMRGGTTKWDPHHD